MQSPVDRVENAARPHTESTRVRRIAESAKEKDDNFSKVLREKMKEEHHEKETEKRKRKKREDELLLSRDSQEQIEKAEPTDLAAESAEADENSSKPKSKDSARIDSIDLTA